MRKPLYAYANLCFYVLNNLLLKLQKQICRKMKSYLIVLLCSLWALNFNMLAAQEKEKTSKDPYKKIIDKVEETHKGLFTIYKTDEKYYFEIGDSLLNRDMLMAVRVSEVSENNKIEAGRMLRDPILVHFTHTNQKIFLRMPQTSEVLKNEKDNIAGSFQRNNISPVMHVFDIESENPQKNGYLIDVTGFLSKEIAFVSPFYDRAKPGRFDASGSYIASAKAFPKNVEIATYLSYTKKTRPFLAKVNRSIVLLPEEPMPMRLHTERIGYYQISRREYSSESNRLETKRYIKRWRIQPKKEDLEKYFAGKLVQPEKPIIFYIDNSFPDAYKPYIKEGVEVWQKAFEEIGFKNAIIAKEYPTNDPDFQSEDIRYSCIRYVASRTANAMGPSWMDPRTGEILQADVLFYHNVVKLIHDWRFVQTAAVDTAARRKVYSEELMGELIRYVIAHEIGHTLGQEHNMRGSYAYPVDSLRSPTFTAKYGSTASIMDYARNNYIAQPGDGVQWLSPPLLGPYDYFSIKYAYQLLEGANTPEEEYTELNNMLIDSMDNPVFVFGEQTISIPVDPAAQQEALGDDAIKASRYGIANAKIIMKNLIEWTAEDGKDYDYTKEIYDELIKQYNRYLTHLLPYFGGCHFYYPVHGQNLNSFVPVPRKKQQQALEFLIEQLRDQSTWIVTHELEQKIGFQRNEIFEIQLRKLDWIMNPAVFQRFELYGKFAKGKDAYTLNEYFADLHKKIFEVANKNKNISDFEKMLLTAYVTNLNLLIKKELKEVEISNEGYETGIYMHNGCFTNVYNHLERSNAVKNVKHIDMIVEPMLLKEIDNTREELKKLHKKANGNLKQFYAYLMKVLDK